MLANLEDNLFVIAPNLAAEAYFLGHGCEYLRRDQPQQAIYSVERHRLAHVAANVDDLRASILGAGHV